VFSYERGASVRRSKPPDSRLGGIPPPRGRAKRFRGIPSRRVLGKSYGGGRFLMSEVALYKGLCPILHVHRSVSPGSWLGGIPLPRGVRPSGDTTPCRTTRLCKVTPVILHGVVSPESPDSQLGRFPRRSAVRTPSSEGIGAKAPMAVLGEGALFYELGTPVHQSVSPDSRLWGIPPPPRTARRGFGESRPLWS
jgi:hypothetical protein